MLLTLGLSGFPRETLLSFIGTEL